MIEHLMSMVQIYLIACFMGVHALYLFLDSWAFYILKSKRERMDLTGLSLSHHHFKLPVSLLMPVHNNVAGVREAVNALMDLSYAAYEIIVINDGSSDSTLEVMTHYFDLEPFPEVYWKRIQTRDVKGVFRSLKYPRLSVVDKWHGGQADAFNAGLNLSRYPLVCTLESGLFLKKDSLEKMVRPFLDHAKTVMVRAIVTPATYRSSIDGEAYDVSLPEGWLARLQLMQILRESWLTAIGISTFKFTLPFAGFITLFRKDSLIAVQGFQSQVSDAEMEAILHLQALANTSGESCTTAVVADVVAWSTARTDWKKFQKKSMDEEHAWLDGLWRNRSRCFQKGSGVLGWIAWPLLILFEGLGPLFEITAYVVMGWMFFWAGMDGYILLLFLFVVVAMGFLVSIYALMIQALSLRLFSRRRELLTLVFVALFESMGGRQLRSLYKVVALFTWLVGKASGRQDSVS
ncbi:MAG: glycosyltransferase family 2 protein [Zetaproteobacteria bacterium]|nr:glycosyltransferase family 2 protein [Zetaproteobacteria bacterium]